MTDFVRTPAKVFGLSFVTPEDAAWMAVRALILSCSSGSDFQTLYLGLLSLKSRDADETGDAEEQFGKSQSLTRREMELLVRFAVGQFAAGSKKMRLDLLQMNRVLSAMFIKKMPKTKALEYLQQESQQAAKLLRDEGDAERASLFYQGKGARTLGELWNKYEVVLPYVYAETLRQQVAAREISGNVQFEDLKYMPEIFLYQIGKISKSRPLKIDALYHLDFE
ncbi:hypothetical protein [Sedimentitalea nanhaiensis]|uniref:Uncharacterized protein n=1 Tax=Sedimentitalea nanhaiensis TaxID=999627 RepID=A0A1I7AZP9_9RHOB|nr:hypothetical protein [Sedimentitalea nanhaiensis]SFT80397.1 hypothetical protein SAMN05216236_10846 [Sedimentitalea nanhaiensis]